MCQRFQMLRFLIFLGSLAYGEVSLLSPVVLNRSLWIWDIGNEVQFNEVEPNDSANVPSTSCGLWLAPSTIVGAGLGMYAGRNFQKGDYFQTVGDVAIPVIDLQTHARRYSNSSWTFRWDEYAWEGRGLRMDHEGVVYTQVAVPGFGAAVNTFVSLENIEEWLPKHNVGGLHRSIDPGIGAFSPYYDRMASATRNIEVGEELFVSYGSGWFEGRDHMKTVPLFDDLDSATDLASNLFHLQDSVPETVLEEIWDIFAAKSRWQGESRILGAFHFDDQDELKQLKNKSLHDIRVEQSRRSIEWLEQHGTCADHIEARQSTIRQAGRGAFASRDLPAGTVVSLLPLIHITDRNRLNMYHLPDDEPDVRKVQHSGYQLLLNYCFGHGDSTLLLCPYGPMSNYVNHNVSLANVMIRWADPKRGNHMPSMLNKSLEDLESDATAKLAFEMVAIRDIKQGEEIFLDYGQEWEQAWQQHVASWKPPPGPDRYTAAWQLNSEPFRTVFDGIEDDGRKYPNNVELRCDQAFADNDEVVWAAHITDGTISTFLAKEAAALLPCELLRIREKDGNLRYTVVMWKDDPDDTSQLINYLVEDIPREGLAFQDRPYTSDIFVEGVFRHDIRIPDEIFPDAWRNTNKNRSS